MGELRYAMPVECPTTLYLNDTELVTVQTTPIDLHDWAVGFLFSEGLNARPGDLMRLSLDEERSLVWADPPVREGIDLGEMRGKRYRTSGRISYERCSKLARLGVGVGAALTAAMDQAYRLATTLRIDLVGYLRSARSLRVYSDGQRLADDCSHPAGGPGVRVVG